VGSHQHEVAKVNFHFVSFPKSDAESFVAEMIHNELHEQPATPQGPSGTPSGFRKLACNDQHNGKLRKINPAMARLVGKTPLMHGDGSSRRQLFQGVVYHRSCKEAVRSCPGVGVRSNAREIVSVVRDSKGSTGEVNEIRATPGWERVRVQIDPGAIDSVGPKEIAQAFEMKETMAPKNGVGYVAKCGIDVKNYGENMIVGHTDDGESVGMRTQCADVEKVLCSVHEVNFGGNVVVLDGGRRHTQNAETGQGRG
jgi:hypothetical protein